MLSAQGRLTTSGWNSLDEQNFEGANTWLEVNSNANQIGEVNQSGFTTLAPGASLNLGKLYLGGTQDLQLSFLLMGQDTALPGKVLYQALTAVAGDYNGNGVVDAADYTIWRDTLGSTTDLRANGDNYGAQREQDRRRRLCVLEVPLWQHVRRGSRQSRRQPRAGTGDPGFGRHEFGNIGHGANTQRTCRRFRR